MDLNTIAEVIEPTERAGLPRIGPGDAVLAGGTWLFSEPQSHLRRLIDITSLRWLDIEVSDRGLSMAATCTVAKLYETPLPAAWLAAPLVAQCCRAFVASFKIWNTATVGGNICLSLPAGPMISLLSALDGVATIWTSEGDTRQVPVLEFVTGAKTNVLQPGEILRQIDIPAHTLMRRAAFRQISLTALGRSAALLIGTVSPQGAFDVTVTASTVRPVRLAFIGIPDAEMLRARIAKDIPRSLYHNDVHGDPRWREHMTFRLAESIRRQLAGDVVP